MALTTSSGIFAATLEQAKLMAEVAGLRMEISQEREESWSVEKSDYYMWQDRQTGGGGCRLVWKNGIAWVSRHSGYPHADITREVQDLFRDMGCEELEGAYWRKNPNIYPQPVEHPPIR